MWIKNSLGFKNEFDLEAHNVSQLVPLEYKIGVGGLEVANV